MPLGGLPEYFHYRWSTSAEEPSVENVQRYLASAKDTILSNYVSTYNTAFKDFYQQTGLDISAEESAMLDFAADGEVTAQDLENALSAANDSAAISNANAGSTSGLAASVQALNDKVTKANTTLTNLNDLMNAFTNNENLYSMVEQSIITEGGNLRTKNRFKSSVIREVVQNILKQPDGTSWNKAAHGHIQTGALPQRLHQWLLLLYALINKKIPKSSIAAVKSEIIAVVKKDLTPLISALGDVGVQTTAIVGTSQFFAALDKTFKDSNLEVHSTKGKFIDYSVDMTNDAYMQSLLTNLEGELLSLNAGQIFREGETISIQFPKVEPKSSQQVWSGTLRANINNVSTKEGKVSKTLNSGSQRIGSISLSHNDALLLLMMRELKLSASDIIGLLQIGIAQEDGGEADAIWEDLREYTRQAMLIPALTGLGREGLSEGTLTTMIKLNDYLIPMPQFLTYLQAALTRQPEMFGERFTGYIQLEGFPNRGKFLSLNEWQPPLYNSWIGAKKRSYMAETSGMRLLQNSKLRLRIRNINLSLLIKAGSVV